MQIQDAVGEHNSDVDIRINLEELGDDRQYMQPSEYNRRRNDEVSPGRRIFARGSSFDLLEILENSLAAGNVGAAGVG